jgi:UDP-glucose 4-epimerase|tara:strand:- start:1702 stop:2559 length:858 start_codon:yes stop_codon:yes gene_type:complete
MKNILITGGAGFVGSHLCERLLKNNYAVFSLDNYFSGTTNNHIEGVVYHTGESRQIADIFKDQKIDTIFHLGEYSRVERSFEDIDLVFDYNWNSIYEILKFAKNKKAKIIYSGSSTKFGDDGTTIQQSPYAFVKHTNSELIKTYCDWFNLKYAITYFYNVYGQREIEIGKYATVVAIFLHLRKSGKKFLPVVSPGTQKRNFTDVRDIVNGLLLVAEKGYGDGYGIGSDQSFSILELASMVGLPVKMLPERRGNRLNAPVITDITKALGWKEQYSLKDYIKKELIL